MRRPEKKEEKEENASNGIHTALVGEARPKHVDWGKGDEKRESSGRRERVRKRLTMLFPGVRRNIKSFCVIEGEGGEKSHSKNGKKQHHGGRHRNIEGARRGRELESSFT